LSARCIAVQHADIRFSAIDKPSVLEVIADGETAERAGRAEIAIEQWHQRVPIWNVRRIGRDVPLAAQCRRNIRIDPGCTGEGTDIAAAPIDAICRG